MSDLQTQIRAYATALEETQAPVGAAEAMEAGSLSSQRLAPVSPPPPRRALRWALGAAALAVAGLSIGTFVWLTGPDTDRGPQQTPTTVAPVTTTPPSSTSTTVRASGTPIGTLPASTYVVVPAGPGGAASIHLVAPDGTVTDLTPERGDHLYPEWSPDGTRVVFEARTATRYQVYTVNRDGTGFTQLTDDPRHSFQAHWSPDGSQIVFVRSVVPYSSTKQEIWLMEADGSDQRMIAAGDSRGPVWSPDGQSVVFLRDGETHRVSTSGGEAERLTDLEAFPISWSPDGRWLAVEAARGATAGGFHDQASDIWLVPADGGEPFQLTSAPGRDYQASWSPDGTRIAFTSTRGEREDVFVIGVDGSGLARLTSEPGIDGAARWLTDDEIIFISDRDGDRALYVMADDGSDVRRVWPERFETLPVWFAGIDQFTG